MHTIWKFELPTTGAETFVLEMPFGAKPIACQMQYGIPVLWATVDDEAGAFPYRFYWAVTGGRLPNEDELPKHIATLQIGALVLHLYAFAPSLTDIRRHGPA